jgi:hypothetical protein
VNTLLWAGLVANALVHLRLAVLEVQDGEDRVQAGEAKAEAVFCWSQTGSAILHIISRTLLSPALTTYKVGKFLLFPRGIKSKFAKEREAQQLEKLWMETNKAEAERQAQHWAQVQQLEAYVRAWVPGEILLAKHEPEQVALTWDHAADAFDTFAEQVAQTKGQPWRVGAGQRIKARVGT